MESFIRANAGKLLPALDRGGERRHKGKKLSANTRSIGYFS
jgi:hypothetical protein